VSTSAASAGEVVVDRGATDESNRNAEAFRKDLVARWEQGAALWRV
jgi:hypothetical protein